MNRIRKIALRFAAGTLVAVLALLAWAYWVEPNRLTTTRLQFPIPEWNGTNNRVRVAVAGDFHARPGDANRLRRVVKTIREGAPDIVILVGDFVNSTGGDSRKNTLDLDAMAAILRELGNGGKTRVFACLGNHDYGFGEAKVRKMLDDAGISVLEPGSERLNFGENCEVFLGGVSNRFLSFIDPATPAPFPPDDFYGAALFVVHSPDLVLDLPREAGYALTLAGHTHGGQICLPGRIPFVPHASRIGDQYAHGMFEEDGKDIFVTRGIGESRLPLRLFCPPEIVFIDLLPTEALPPELHRTRAGNPRKIVLPDGES